MNAKSLLWIVLPSFILREMQQPQAAFSSTATRESQRAPWNFPPDVLGVGDTRFSR